MTDIDWNAIKTEYVTGNISTQRLAEKYGISVNTLRKRSTKESWSKERQKYGQKVVKTAVARAGARDARRLEKLQRAGTRMCTELEKLMKDAKEQLYTHVAVEGEGEGMSSLVARNLGVIDDRKLLNISKSIDTMARAMRSLYDLQTAGEKAQLDMAREALEIKRRAQDTKEQEAQALEGVDVVMPESMEAYVK